MYIGFKEIIFILIGVALGIFVNIYFNNKKQSEITRTIITKKDLCYWIFILLIAGIFWSSERLYNLPDFTEYIGFAGTITSIILGVVAIIYSFFQGYDNSKNITSMNEVYKDIKESNNSLRISNSELKENVEEIINMKEDFQKTIEHYREVEGNINELNKEIKVLKLSINLLNRDMKQSIKQLGIELKIEQKDKSAWLDSEPRSKLEKHNRLIQSIAKDYLISNKKTEKSSDWGDKNE